MAMRCSEVAVLMITLSRSIAGDSIVTRRVASAAIESSLYPHPPESSIICTRVDALTRVNEGAPFCPCPQC